MIIPKRLPSQNSFTFLLILGNETLYIQLSRSIKGLPCSYLTTLIKEAKTHDYHNKIITQPSAFIKHTVNVTYLKYMEFIFNPLANIEDPDVLLQHAPFHQCLHRLLRQN